ncbi:MAG: methyltransferase domain-containing protein [Pseudomonadales bacterium]
MGSRKSVRCVQCGSLERTRVAQLLLDRLGLVQPGSRIMHIAPERGIYERIRKVEGVVYEVYDLEPGNFPFADVQPLDLAAQCEQIPSNTYDLIIHSHVMEHVPCDAAVVFFHLQRSLKETGRQVFSIPILSGHWDSCFGGVDDDERVRRFGQADHVRRYGVLDLERTLGMLFPLPEKYDLTELVPEEDLDRYNIPEYARSGFSSSSVFVMGKADFKLRLD